MADKQSSPEREKYQQLLAKLIGGRPVAYWPYLARMLGGVKSAVMMSQLLYWNGDTTVQKEKGGWFYKTILEMEIETGLTKEEQQTARKLLTGLGVIETKLKGVPRVWFYRVVMDALTDYIIEWESHSMGLPSNGETVQYRAVTRSNDGRFSRPMSGGNPVQLNKNQRLHTETTTETTKDSSSSGSAKKLKKKEEEEESKLSPAVRKALSGIGVFRDLWEEVAASGFTDAEILSLIQGATEEKPDPPETAKIFIYRLRNTPRGAAITPEDQEKQQRSRYIDDLDKYGIEH